VTLNELSDQMIVLAAIQQKPNEVQKRSNPDPE
jgi:hypothetical protein